MLELHDHWTQLSQQQLRLQQHWQQTREAWDDAASQRFEREYWHELDHSLKATLQALESLAQVVDQAQRGIK